MLVDEGRITAGGGEQPPAAVAAHPGARRPRRRPGVLGARGRCPATATCSAATGCPAWSAPRPSARRCASTPTRSSASSGWSQLALRGGGPDNITVIVADVTDAGHRRGDARSSAAPPPATGAWRPPPTTRPRPPGRRRSPRRAPRRARGAGGRRRRRAGPADAPPGAHRAPCWWCCWSSLGGGALRRLDATPSRSTTSAPPTTARSRSSAASRVRSPGSTCPACTRRSDARARRPHPGRAGAGQAGHPGRERAGRRAPAGRADQRRPEQPQPEAALPADPTPAHADAHRRRRRPRRPPASADAPTPVAGATDRRRTAPSRDRRPPRPTHALRPARRRSTRPAAGRPSERRLRSEDSTVTAAATPAPSPATAGERSGVRLAPVPAQRRAGPAAARHGAGGRVRGDRRGEPARHGHRRLLDAGRRARRGLPRRCTWSIRFLAPYADPVLLPAVALLNGSGWRFLRRLDLGDAAGAERADLRRLRRRRRPAARLDARSR